MLTVRDISARLFSVTRMRSALADGVLLTLVALGVNFVLAPDDIGFAKLSPSPLLLIPVIIGCRHGLRPGLFSGLLVSAIGIGALAARGKGDEWNVEEDLWNAVAPPLVGFICGGAVTALLGRMRVIRNEAARLRRTTLMMGSEIRMLRHDMDELMRQSVIDQVRKIKLEDDLRSLMLRPSEELADTMMAILRNHAQIREAALYTVDADDTHLTRVALLGDDRRLPASMDLRDHPMLAQSVELARVTSANIEAKIETIVSADHLVAAPVEYGDRVTHLLVVTDLPLIAFTARTVRLVAIVCKCMEECLAMNRHDEKQFRLVPGGLNRRLYTAKAFRRHLAANRKLAAEEYSEWRLCVITAPAAGPGAKQDLENAVMPVLDAEQITHTPEDDTAAMFIILPWTNRNNAVRFEKRLRDAIAKHFTGGEASVTMLTNPDEAACDALLASGGPAS